MNSSDANVTKDEPRDAAKPDASVIARYEAKYLVPDALARRIAQDLVGICSVDHHAGADGTYLVNNVYFDTPDLRFYHDTRHHNPTRFKPRLRYYGTEPQGRVWLEVKHKTGGVTWKVRRTAPASMWSALCEGGVMPKEAGLRGGEAGLELRSAEPCTLQLLESFEEIVQRFGAEPRLHIRYVREAYVSDLDRYARITFDRGLSFRPFFGPSDFTYYDDSETCMSAGSESPVVLEIKTETEVPNWVMGLIRRFGLSRRGFSKYANATDRWMSDQALSRGALTRSACYGIDAAPVREAPLDAAPELQMEAHRCQTALAGRGGDGGQSGSGQGQS